MAGSVFFPLQDWLEWLWRRKGEGRFVQKMIDLKISAGGRAAKTEVLRCSVCEEGGTRAWHLTNLGTRCDRTTTRSASVTRTPISLHCNSKVEYDLGPFKFDWLYQSWLACRCITSEYLDVDMWMNFFQGQLQTYYVMTHWLTLWYSPRLAVTLLHRITSNLARVKTAAHPSAQISRSNTCPVVIKPFAMTATHALWPKSPLVRMFN